MSTITFISTKAQIDTLYTRYATATKRKTPPYAHWQIALSDCVITAYQSGKVVLQGEGAQFHAEGIQGKVVTPKKQADKQSSPSIPIQYPQWGSDEVGTGDYFGPVCVCAAAIDEPSANWLKSLGIQDSKAMKDAYIMEIGAQLRDRLLHSLLILDNATYNRVHKSDHMVAIKCKLHNQAFVHLSRKCSESAKQIIVDQFVPERSYYRYLKQEKQVIHGIHFETKAENKYLAVAAASVIARYTFLSAFNTMCKNYDFPFLKGAGAKVDACIADFVAKHGTAPLYQVAKLHFANTQKAGITLDSESLASSTF